MKSRHQKKQSYQMYATALMFSDVLCDFNVALLKTSAFDLSIYIRRGSNNNNCLCHESCLDVCCFLSAVTRPGEESEVAEQQ